jgi:hypothetical protein
MATKSITSYETVEQQREGAGVPVVERVHCESRQATEIGLDGFTEDEAVEIVRELDGKADAPTYEPVTLSQAMPFGNDHRASK